MNKNDGNNYSCRSIRTGLSAARYSTLICSLPFPLVAVMNAYFAIFLLRNVRFIDRNKFGNFGVLSQFPSPLVKLYFAERIRYP